MAWIRVFDESELPDGERRVVEAAGTKVLVMRHRGQLYAVNNSCPHMGLPLKGGRLTEDGAIVCPFHRSAFDLATGDVKLWSPWPPLAGRILGLVSREQSLAVYPVKVEENAIWIDVTDPPGG